MLKKTKVQLKYLKKHKSIFVVNFSLNTLRQQQKRAYQTKTIAQIILILLFLYVALLFFLS